MATEVDEESETDEEPVEKEAEEEDSTELSFRSGCCTFILSDTSISSSTSIEKEFDGATVSMGVRDGAKKFGVFCSARSTGWRVPLRPTMVIDCNSPHNTLKQ